MSDYIDFSRAGLKEPEPPRASSGLTFGQILLIAALIFGGWWVLNNPNNVRPTPQPDDYQEQIVIDDDEDKQQKYGDLWMLCVYESKDNEANFLSIYEDLSYRESLNARGMQPYFQDIDQVADKYKAEAEKVGLPAIVLVDKETDEPVVSFKQPDGGQDALNKMLKEKVGK